MSELRRDPITGRWVIVDTDHPNSPADYLYDQHTFRGGTCPFCVGNEHMTPPEIEALREPGSHANGPGWYARVVPNKFPALQIEGDLEKQGMGIYDMSSGIGAHEVLIESPHHHKDIHELQNHEIEQYLSLSCSRALDLTRDRRFKYIMVFKNFGVSAGASLEHPHTQLIALPMVPKSVAEEIKGAQNYFEFRERCIFCDIIRQETEEKERIVSENRFFISFCPVVSRFPFEIWIMPKKHSAYFCHMQSDEIPALAQILKETVAKLKKIFPNICYNYILHSSPVNSETSIEGYHWHIEFMPKLTRVAGFEWGSGFYLVATPPERAAQYLKDVSV